LRSAAGALGWYQQSLASAWQYHDARAVVYALSGVAASLAAAGNWQQAARLFGASEAMHDASGLSFTLESLDRQRALGLPEPWLHSSVPGPMVCFARSVTLFLSPFFSLRLKNVVLLSAGFETALDEAVKNCKALAEAAEQKEAERVAMSEAISAFCQAFGLDGVPSGSSSQSHLRALGGYVRNRLCGALHHGVRRAFAVLASHYDVDLERVSEGYCLPDEEEAALAEV